MNRLEAKGHTRSFCLPVKMWATQTPTSLEIVCLQHQHYFLLLFFLHSVFASLSATLFSLAHAHAWGVSQQILTCYLDDIQEREKSKNIF